MPGCCSLDQIEKYVDLVRQFMQDYFHNTKAEMTTTSRKSMHKNGEFNDNMTSWKINAIKDLTKQINGSDCGMHTCINMKLIS